MHQPEHHHPGYGPQQTCDEADTERDDTSHVADARFVFA
jgi:hypothetical protein